MEYNIIRSSRKTMALQVTSELEVVVRAPKRMPAREISRFVAMHEEWITRQKQHLMQRALHKPPLTQEGLSELKALACDILPPLVERYAQVMQLYPTSVKITGAKTRFGSCSAKNGLCFSFYLMRYPMEAIEYVVVHELAHIKQKNHSAAFYAIVAACMPDYKERRKLLKQ